MGWASGGEVFDPVAREVVRRFQQAEISRATGRKILATLIEALQARGWDTEAESLGEFLKHDFIVAAFRDCGVEEGAEWDDLRVDAEAIAHGREL